MYIDRYLDLDPHNICIYMNTNNKYKYTNIMSVLNKIT